MFSISLVGIAEAPAQTQPQASTSAGQSAAPVQQGASAPGTTNPASIQGGAQTQSSTPTATQTPSQGQPSQSQPSQPQPPQGQPSQSQPSQAPPSQVPAQTGTDSQTSSADDNGTFVFKKQVEEVVLHATVVDDKDQMIVNLPKDAFSVYENGKLQPITSFRREDVPVAMGIVIDNSGSMREKRDKVNTAALNLVRASNPGDQVFVVNFNDDYYLDQDFTNSLPKLKQALEKVEARGGTALYDALVASADYLKGAKLQKKVLFVVTDGEDNGSRENLEEAVERLQQENGPTVYAIGLLGQEKERTARRALQVLAERTGGIAFLPKSLDQVDEISSTVARDIRSQYTIGYKPLTPKTVPGYRTIHVDAKQKGYKKLVVRTKTGYYPGQEQASN
ncbi:MAG TPA: VWA domain-containing protein [Terriglobales bacterium]